MAAMAAFTFSSCEDVPAPYDMPNKPDTPDTPELTTDGSEQNPYTVTDAKTAASGSDKYIKAYIVGFIPDKSLSEAVFSATDAVNLNVIIAASADETDVNKCMPVQLPSGDIRNAINLKDNPTNLKQEVILCGSIETYFGAVGLKSTCYAKINGKEYGTKPGASTPDTPIAGEAKGTGTAEDPFNSVAAINYTKALAADVNSDKDVYIKGKVREVKEQYGAQYGNTTVTIADDDNSDAFTIYRALYFGNKKWTEGGAELKVGDEVVFCGKVVNFKGNTPETAQGEAYLISLNGKTSYEGGGSTTPDTPTEGEGVKIDGTTVTMTSSYTAGESIKVDLNTIGLTAGTVDKAITLDDGTTITFEQGDGKSAPAFNAATKGIRVYANNKIIFNGKSNIAKIIMICDSYNGTDYVGNETATVSFSGKTATYTNVFTGTGGGTQLRVKNIEIFYAK